MEEIRARLREEDRMEVLFITLKVLSGNGWRGVVSCPDPTQLT